MAEKPFLARSDSCRLNFRAVAARQSAAVASRSYAGTSVNEFDCSAMRPIFRAPKTAREAGMPKLFGLNLVPVLVASVAFFVVGFLWYGVIFSDAWMAAQGVTEADAGSPVWMVGGFVITIMQVVALGLILKWRNIAGPSPAVQTALVLWLLLALPFTLYAYFFIPAHNATLLMIDASHLLVGWGLAAAVLATMKV
jgi:hypothetical protein